MWCKLRRVALLIMRRGWLEALVKACMQRHSILGIVHNKWRSVAECGPVECEIGGVKGLLVYMTQ